MSVVGWIAWRDNDYGLDYIFGFGLTSKAVLAQKKCIALAPPKVTYIGIISPPHITFTLDLHYSPPFMVTNLGLSIIFRSAILLCFVSCFHLF